MKTTPNLVIDEPPLVSRPEVKAIGLSVRTTNRAESDPKKAKIPALWHRFYGDNILDQIPNKKGGILGVYTSYESDSSGAYDLIAAAEVASLDHIPSGMVGVIIPAGKYLVFPADGPMPNAIIKAWGVVWAFFSKTPQYRRAYTTDFELYKGPASAEIYIAIR